MGNAAGIIANREYRRGFHGIVAPHFPEDAAGAHEIPIPIGPEYSQSHIDPPRNILCRGKLLFINLTMG
jgi:hypothetical protein